ncbi:MAG: 2-amino-4-hydroxy-6-hydroxymethyldihydropteridine diphosphokinase [Flavobacteriales bacterium]|nr:2-amino-4-hydroxy-6-hydroxymethyldihydropteridine diphosphokinase [Flavobacteriales bacterium]
MNRAVLLMGGNLGNVPVTFSRARGLIATQVGEIISTSSLYLSDAWGFEAKEQFYNQVLIVNTGLSAQHLLNKILEIEDFFGRTRNQNEGYQSRTLDLDILFFNHEVIVSESLQIPHPRLHFRNFTLVPLAELMPEYIHPVLQVSVRQLLYQSKDKLRVQKL